MFALTSDFPVPGGALFARTLLEEMLKDKDRMAMNDKDLLIVHIHVF